MAAQNCRRRRHRRRSHQPSIPHSEHETKTARTRTAHPHTRYGEWCTIHFFLPPNIARGSLAVCSRLVTPSSWQFSFGNMIIPCRLPQLPHDGILSNVHMTDARLLWCRLYTSACDVCVCVCVQGYLCAESTRDPNGFVEYPCCSSTTYNAVDGTRTLFLLFTIRERVIFRIATVSCAEEIDSITEHSA